MAIGTRLFQLVTKAYRNAPSLAKAKTTAMEWYREAAKKIRENIPGAIGKYYTSRPGIDRIKSKGSFDISLIGRLIIFEYNAFHRKTLPYWDALPIVLPIKLMPQTKFGPGKEGPGFMGLNLHYLPEDLRAKFLDAILVHYRMKHLDERQKLNLNYKLLNTTAKLKLFKPCVKHYLFKQMRSRFNVIHPVEWGFVIMLPIARWRKKSEAYVHADSRRKLGI